MALYHIWQGTNLHFLLNIYLVHLSKDILRQIEHLASTLVVKLENNLK